MSAPYTAAKNPIAVVFSLLISAIVLMLALPAAASAAETYKVQGTFAGCSQWGAGQADAAGTIYASCGAKVIRYSSTGERLSTILLPASTNDVAPSPDGSIIYFTYGGELRRMVRNVFDNYSYDLFWKPQKFRADGAEWVPSGYSLATDAWGDIYFSNGGWQPGQPNIILKFTPAGNLLTQFGTWGAGAGEFNVNFGLTVTRDGRTIYTAESTNGRIQRFDYVGGTYRFTTMWGQSDPMNCQAGAYFAAPYDVGVDPWGDVYVMDTTCRRVQKFGPNGEFLGITAQHSANGTLAHGISVGHHGEFVVGQWGERWVRSADNPEPGPIPGPLAPLPPADVAAPVINAVTVPNPATSRDIDITVDATDDTGIVEVRIANNDGEWSEWKPFTDPVAYTLTAGNVYKLVTVQVRDAVGNESNVVTRTTLLQEQPVGGGDDGGEVDGEAPVVTDVAVPNPAESRDIAVAIVADDNVAVTQVRVAGNDGEWGAWQQFQTPLAHTLTAGNVYKLVTVQVRDAVGNESNVVTRTTLLQEQPVGGGDDGGEVDGEAPVVTDVAVPNPAESRDIAVAIVADDNVAVTQVRVAGNDGEWGAWQQFQTPLAHTLTAGNVYKLVSVQVRDAAGNESNVVTRTTLLQEQPVGGGDDGAVDDDGDAGDGDGDATAPVIQSVDIPALTATRTIGVKVVADEPIAEVNIANLYSGEWTGWQPFADPIAHELIVPENIMERLIVVVRDAAGNESERFISGTTIIDTRAPQVRRLAGRVVRGVARVNITAKDNVRIVKFRFSTGKRWSTWRKYGRRQMIRVGKARGKVVLRIQLMDSSRNVSKVYRLRVR